MPEPARRWRLRPERQALVQRDLDGIVALYDESSGQTHLLGAPLPQLLEALGAGPADVKTLLARLNRAYRLGDGAADAIAQRCDELVALGLAEAG